MNLQLIEIYFESILITEDISMSISDFAMTFIKLISHRVVFKLATINKLLKS